MKNEKRCLISQPEGSHIYLDDVIDQWCDHLRLITSTKTRYNYRGSARAIVGDRPLDDPTSITAGMAVYTRGHPAIYSSITATRNLYQWMRATGVLPEDICNRALALLSPDCRPHSGCRVRGK